MIQLYRKVWDIICGGGSTGKSKRKFHINNDSQELFLELVVVKNFAPISVHEVHMKQWIRYVKFCNRIPYIQEVVCVYLEFKKVIAR